MSERADLLIHARWIVPVEPADLVLEQHSIAINDGRILALLPQQQARQRYLAAKEVELPDHVLIPGLVNLHTHAAMNLLRGYADDLPLMRWLQEAIWPAEGKHISPGFVRDGTLLAAAEMLRGGVTTCNDMYFYPDAAAEAFDAIGLRAVVGMTITEFPTPYASDADDYLRKGLAARDRWRGHPRLGFSLAPHAPYTVADATLERISSIAGELEAPIHIHVQETSGEISDSLAAHGLRPLARLEKLGVLGPETIAVHSVHLDDSDIDRLARLHCNVAHCPTSNLKLASGIAPVPGLVEAGVNVGLGTDGAASNNRLDLFQEMRLAALLAKVSSQDAAALPAHQALRMATLNGARALGLDDRIGSLLPGKQADLCAVVLNDLNTRPCYDPVSHLVYVAGREQVSHVWIDGEARVNQGSALLQISDIELLRLSAVWQTKLVS
ncbi:TRZ/ATZ family hydrolase [Azoarcus indigens]|uniref:5-methylthioadenosine/S-adenosylhomocysteine deaminase n=1 Tax=Azoarcus indigens TaxID=29545 RepID=A0A4R6EGX6_9RHOO|nr:TRZ/ATZ family hydrolase [Azoarcus indigens]NMG63512.1 TRZ/ATZ family hydrolase [Azoarcus indigens]TDN57063.1 5-methylthioadenosine/S-adenosylhomocysteine deaminase [Azoarcus indigens]